MLDKPLDVPPDQLTPPASALPGLGVATGEQPATPAAVPLNDPSMAGAATEKTDGVDDTTNPAKPRQPHATGPRKIRRDFALADDKGRTMPPPPTYMPGAPRTPPTAPVPHPAAEEIEETPEIAKAREEYEAACDQLRTFEGQRGQHLLEVNRRVKAEMGDFDEMLNMAREQKIAASQALNKLLGV